MTTIYISKRIQKSRDGIRRLVLAGILTAAGPALITGAEASEQRNPEAAAHQHSRGSAPAKLVEVVRNATRQYTDVNVATAAKYQPLFGCVSGPDQGAMGVHYINLPLVGDGELDETKPEALIYEPSQEGLRLVGVEFIVDAATWLAHHNAPPMIQGQAFQFVNSPNRYGLPAFFELHVWAWRDNPNGAFVDWNRRVSCEGQ
jgi:hypothetical protein